MLSLALLALSALPGGTVIAGISTTDGRHTDVTALLPDGTARLLFVEAHAPGIVPKGTLVDDALVLAVQADGADGASVVVAALTGERAVVGERALASQAPALLDDGSVLYVRAAERPARSTFDIVRARDGAEELVAAVDGAWLTPVRGAAGQFLFVDVDGAHSLMHLDGTALVHDASLGKGRIRSPSARAHERDGALVVDGRVVQRGLPGMDPLTVGDVVVAGAGTKRAGVVVVAAAERAQLIDLAYAGIASPRAAAVVAGAVVVVVWLDRGHALPGELWLASTSGPARRLSEPRAGVAVEVYGVTR